MKRLNYIKLKSFLLWLITLPILSYLYNLGYSGISIVSSGISIISLIYLLIKQSIKKENTYIHIGLLTPIFNILTFIFVMSYYIVDFLYKFNKKHISYDKNSYILFRNSAIYFLVFIPIFVYIDNIYHIIDMSTSLTTFSLNMSILYISFIMSLFISFGSFIYSLNKKDKEFLYFITLIFPFINILFFLILSFLKILEFESSIEGKVVNTETNY